MNEPKCPDCQVEMEVGFLPDHAHARIIQTSWYRGEAEPQTVFGFEGFGLKLDLKKCMPVTAYRCPECGLLRLYANEAEKE